MELDDLSTCVKEVQEVFKELSEEQGHTQRINTLYELEYCANRLAERAQRLRHAAIVDQSEQASQPKV